MVGLARACTAQPGCACSRAARAERCDARAWGQRHKPSPPAPCVPPPAAGVLACWCCAAPATQTDPEWRSARHRLHSGVFGGGSRAGAWVGGEGSGHGKQVSGCCALICQGHSGYGACLCVACTRPCCSGTWGSQSQPPSLAAPPAHPGGSAGRPGRRAGRRRTLAERHPAVAGSAPPAE